MTNPSHSPAHSGPSNVVAGQNAASRKSRSEPEAAPAACKPHVAPQARHAMIAEAAFYRSRLHADESGRDLEDWLAAELEVDAKLQLSARLS